MDINAIRILVQNPDLEYLALALKRPNIFRILNISQQEIRHSNFLAWLLTPQGSHNLGDSFLKWFLKELFVDEKIGWSDTIKVEQYDLSNANIYREYLNIDILIEHKDFIIVIENKINSKEHSNQLGKYIKRIESQYKNRDLGFVILTKDSSVPTNERYCSIDYSMIMDRLEILKELYFDSVSEKIKFYINDYIEILKEEIMEDSDLIKKAQEVYKNNQEALDFIFDHKPDNLLKIKDKVESTIENEGFLLQTCNKGKARFLTSKLAEIDPKTGKYGWKNKETFNFEIKYSEKVTMKFVIAPGDENNRIVISEALRNIVNDNINISEPQGEKWLVFFKANSKKTVNKEEYAEEDNNKANEIIREILENNGKAIEEIEKAIDQVKNKLDTPES